MSGSPSCWVVFEDGSVRDDLGDDGAAIAQLLGDDLAADVGPRQQDAQALERSRVGQRHDQRLGPELGRIESTLRP